MEGTEWPRLPTEFPNVFDPGQLPQVSVSETDISRVIAFGKSVESKEAYYNRTAPERRARAKGMVFVDGLSHVLLMVVVLGMQGLLTYCHILSNSDYTWKAFVPGLEHSFGTILIAVKLYYLIQSRSRWRDHSTEQGFELRLSKGLAQYFSERLVELGCWLMLPMKAVACSRFMSGVFVGELLFRPYNVDLYANRKFAMVWNGYICLLVNAIAIFLFHLVGPHDMSDEGWRQFFDACFSREAAKWLGCALIVCWLLFTVLIASHFPSISSVMKGGRSHPLYERYMRLRRVLEFRRWLKVELFMYKLQLARLKRFLVILTFMPAAMLGLPIPDQPYVKTLHDALLTNTMNYELSDATEENPVLRRSWGDRVRYWFCDNSLMRCSGLVLYGIMEFFMAILFPIVLAKARLYEIVYEDGMFYVSKRYAIAIVALLFMHISLCTMKATLQIRMFTTDRSSLLQCNLIGGLVIPFVLWLLFEIFCLEAYAGLSPWRLLVAAACVATVALSVGSVQYWHFRVAEDRDEVVYRDIDQAAPQTNATMQAENSQTILRSRKDAFLSRMKLATDKAKAAPGCVASLKTSVCPYVEEG